MGYYRLRKMAMASEAAVPVHGPPNVVPIQSPTAVALDRGRWLWSPGQGTRWLTARIRRARAYPPEIQAGMMRYLSQDGTPIDVSCSRPVAAGCYPGVIVMMEAFGWVDPLRDVRGALQNRALGLWRPR